MKNNEFETVAELIAHLQTLPQNSQPIFDNDGNCFGITPECFGLWDENDPNSPVAIYIEWCAFDSTEADLPGTRMEIEIGDREATIYSRDKEIIQIDRVDDDQYVNLYLYPKDMVETNDELKEDGCIGEIIFDKTPAL